MSAKTSDTQIGDVSDTSFWVAYYRAKESERADALFRDPFALALAGERGERIAEEVAAFGKYTEWIVISRTVIIDRFIERAIAGGVDGVVNLGAGLDARPYRMKLPASLEWVEADFQRVIDYKSEVLKSATPTCNLTRVAVDLSRAQERRRFLAQAAPNAQKILVLTEGVIPYLSVDEVANLARDLAAQPRVVYWIAEYFSKDVYKHIRTNVRQMKMRNAPFRFFPDDWYGFFRQLGWKEQETRFNSEIAAEFRRQAPMPTLARWIFPLLPKKLKEASAKMTGFVIFER